MKRIFAAVLSAMLVLSLAACTDSTENSSQSSSGSSSVAEQSSEPDTSDLTVKEDVSNLDTNSEAEPEQSESSQLEQNDFGDTTLILTFDQAAKEKVLEMEGAQNVEVLTDLTGDELEILDPYGAELVTYGICYETLSNTIHKLAELLNEENMEA